MKKKDLKYENYVVLKSGSVCIITMIKGTCMLVDIKEGRWMSLENYGEDLKHSNNKFTIMKVFKDYTLKELLWERKELPQLSEDEKAILRNLPKKCEWIARDENNYLFVYGTKPSKNPVNRWNNEAQDYENFNLFNHLFAFIKWKDEEPYYIPDLLEEGE